MVLDTTPILTAILSGIYSQIYSFAASIYPSNPLFVILIGAIIALYLVSKISKVAMYIVAAFAVIVFLGGLK